MQNKLILLPLEKASNAFCHCFWTEVLLKIHITKQEKSTIQVFYPYLDYDIFPQHTQMQREAEDPLAENNELLQGTPRKETFITVIYISI